MYKRQVMRRASEASLFFLGFSGKNKPLHNGSYEHRVPKIKKQNIRVFAIKLILSIIPSTVKKARFIPASL